MTWVVEKTSLSGNDSSRPDLRVFLHFPPDCCSIFLQHPAIPDAGAIIDISFDARAEKTKRIK